VRRPGRAFPEWRADRAVPWRRQATVDDRHQHWVASESFADAPCPSARNIRGKRNPKSRSKPRTLFPISRSRRTKSVLADSSVRCSRASVAIGLDGHRRQGGPDLPSLHQHRREPGRRQASHQPSDNGPASKPIRSGGSRRSVISAARAAASLGTAFDNHGALRVPHTDSRLLQRDIEHDIKHHLG
jgi:hypothetical protein